MVQIGWGWQQFLTSKRNKKALDHTIVVTTPGQDKICFRRRQCRDDRTVVTQDSESHSG